MSLFAKLSPVTPDSVFGLSARFRHDPRKSKVDLGAGVYRNNDLQCSVFPSVIQAEQELARESRQRSYLKIIGLEKYLDLTCEILYGTKISKDFYAAQTLGGTGALRITGELLALAGCPMVHFPELTWENHKPIFQQCGLRTNTYPYYARSSHQNQFDSMMAHFEKISPGEAVILHASCHNPTGTEILTPQWHEIAEIIKTRQGIAIFDVAYKGLGADFNVDALAPSIFLKHGVAHTVAFSYSKIMGLYGERVGALFVYIPEDEYKEILSSQINAIIRRNYSNPPCHGGWVVEKVLSEAPLRRAWLEEISSMRGRLSLLRNLLEKHLTEFSGSEKFQYLKDQVGMFSLLPLNPKQVAKLEAEYGIYMLPNGRINIAGLTEKIIPYVAERVVEAIES